MERQNISTGTSWEKSVGYSRAVRIGPHVWVAGTTALDGTGQVVGEGDAYTQTAYILQKIGGALGQAGANLNDVVRTRIFVTDATLCEAVGQAHGEVFADIRPTSTMVAVRALVAPEMLVEIEAEAFVREPGQEPR